MTVAKYSDKMTQAEAVAQFGQRVAGQFAIPGEQRLWQAWAAAGVLPLLHVGDGEWEAGGGAQLEVNEANAPFGLSFDEFRSTHDQQRRAELIERFRQVKHQRPQVLIAAWIAPFVALSEQIAVARDAIDLLIPETYVGYVKTPPSRIEERISEAKTLGVSASTILGLWIGEKGTPPEVVMPWTADHPGAEPDLDAQLATLRRLAPEMPGVALYMVHPGNVDWLAEYDAVIDKHFYAPVPSVIIAETRAGAGELTVRVLARPNRDTNCPVVQYRYFLDATCVRVCGSPAVTLPIVGVSPGEHMVTAHAVDAAQLAGVDQVRVTL